MRILLGVGFGGTGVAFSMFSEFLPIKNRGTYLVTFEVFWTIGILFETLLAWCVRTAWTCFTPYLYPLPLLGLFCPQLGGDGSCL